MVNKLPSSKQTKDVKALIDKQDVMGSYFSSAHNFINMDDELREKLVERYQDTGVYTGGEKDDKGKPLKGKIPEGAPLFSDQSFIRLELAFKILNTCNFKLEATKVEDCTLVEKGFSYEIDINTTTCRAFPYMFSTDSSILYIPNEEAPEFGLLDALTSTTPVSQFVQIESGSLKSKTQDINLANKYTPEGPNEVSGHLYAFPARTSLSDDKYFETVDERGIDSTILEKDAPKGYWGYLRNLYINFDFFCEVISRSNVVTKDIYYELLNGKSSDVNS